MPPKKVDDPNIPNLTPVDTEVVDPPVVDSPPEVVKPSTDDSAALRAEFAEMNRQALSENAAELSRLRQENETLRNATPTKPKDESFNAFMENPRSAVREEIQAVVAPLLELRSELTKERQYNALKAGLAKSPQLKRLYDKVAPYVDHMMASQDATPANLQASIISAYGAHEAGLLEPIATDTPTPTPTPKVPDTPTPPHIPPSPPPAPRKAAPTANAELDGKVEALTETERRIARAQGFTDLKQYVLYRDADPEVSTWSNIPK
jgi:hypothetical protein